MPMDDTSALDPIYLTMPQQRNELAVLPAAETSQATKEFGLWSPSYQYWFPCL